MSNNNDLNQEVAAIWDANAAWWDKTAGEGDMSHSMLIRPAMERLLELKEGETLLEVACGNGSFARKLAWQGAGKIVAFDFSANFIEIARSRTETAGLSDKTEYHLIDATDEAALLALGEGRFDAAYASMALMDMAQIDPLMRAMSRLLKPGGRFVFSVTHPCFNHSGITRIVEEATGADGILRDSYSVKILEYASYKDGAPKLGTGIPGQPKSQYYFERTLSGLFAAGFKAGLVLDGLEEPIFSLDTPARSAMSWVYFREIPPFMIARMRLLRRDE